MTETRRLVARVPLASVPVGDAPMTRMLVASRLPLDEPPAATVATNLPPERTSFVGRQDQIDQLRGSRRVRGRRQELGVLIEHRLRPQQIPARVGGLRRSLW